MIYLSYSRRLFLWTYSLTDTYAYCSVMFWCFMMTSSNGNVFRVISPLYGEFTGTSEVPSQRPVTRSFDVFFDLNKQLSKPWWGWWFETPWRSLWRHYNVSAQHFSLMRRNRDELSLIDNNNDNNDNDNNNKFIMMIKMMVITALIITK